MTSGPYARGRIIDLSKRAAELLDVVETGTGKVRRYYLGRAELMARPPGDPAGIANALPAAPPGQVDTAALGIVPGAPVAPPGKTTRSPPRRSRPRCSQTTSQAAG